MRREDWQQRFWNVINAHLQTSFEWGVFDCVIFGVKIIEAITFRQFSNEVKALFGEWSNARQAARAIGPGLDISSALVLGKRVAKSKLEMGDIGYAIDDEGKHLIVVHDGAGFICPAAVGFQRMPDVNVQFGWKI